jgi:carotenoid cleavage dioxygenase
MSVTEDRVTDPYLSGVYAPVNDEVDLVDLEITGTIPSELEGSFLRNGPNPVFEPAGRYHLFDGDGMIHELAISGGRARYRNRWIRSRGLAAEQSAGRALYGGMATASFPGPDVVGDAGPVKNVANTHVVRHAGQVMALWEAGPPTVLDHELRTVGTTDFGGQLQGPFTAHPKIDPATGEMFAFGYSAIASSKKVSGDSISMRGRPSRFFERWNVSIIVRVGPPPPSPQPKGMRLRVA